jgi:hypothetical protein
MKLAHQRLSQAATGSGNGNAAFGKGLIRHR